MTITLTAFQKQRRDTASNWTSNNPTLLAGEWGIESDTKKFKIGDGSTAWQSLDYVPIPDTNRLLTGNLTVGGDFQVNGTTTTVNTTNLDVKDKNISLNKVSTPSDTLADGGGISLLGGTTKTFNWVDATDSWTSSEHLDLASGKVLKVAGTQILSSTQYTGNSATATALGTARTIGGVSFDGTANINLPGVNTSGSQDTSGTAAIATTITITDESSDTTCFPLFATAASGNLAPKSGSNLAFNSSSGVLTATGFSGALTGNVTGNVSGSSGSTTGNAATATALANARTIAGVSFNGTANISLNNNAITNGAGYITGSSLNASNLSSGTIPDARFPAALPAVSGANLTNLPSAGIANVVDDTSPQLGGLLDGNGQTANFTANNTGLGIPIGTDANEPSASSFKGFIRFNDDDDKVYFSDGSNWLKMTPTTSVLSSVSGNIFVSSATNLTLSGSGFLSSGLVVNFTQSSDSINTDVTVTPSSDTAATVAVPAAVYNNVTANNAVTIKVTNSDGKASGNVNKTAVNLPSGGSISTSGSFRIHTFTSSGTFVNTIASNSVQYLVVAGGGGGGNTVAFGTSGSSGGGAGGYRSSVSGESSGGGASAESALTLSTGNYTVTVGGGGSGTSSHATGSNGNNSVFGTITSIGGGGGGGGSGTAGNGGSGGGKAYSGGVGSGTAGQGHDGGDHGERGGGGGGGAGAVGQSRGGGDSNGGAGGVGVSSSINGSATTRAGGGGGSGSSSGSGGSGGSGGGGTGTGNSGTGGSGSGNTGGGGGGTGPGGGTSGSGGSGIVIVRYTI